MHDGRGFRDAYLRSFRTHVHELIAMGYRELHAETFAHSEEPEITGELVRAMRLLLERESAPRWVAYYAIHDDPPLSVSDKLGKKRPRVDVEFERVLRGRRPRFRFEAKRLRRAQDVGQYVGKDGLGCFTSGKYPLTHPEAGMLGYVQNGDEPTWAVKIKMMLSRKPEAYAIVDHDVWDCYRLPVITNVACFGRP